MRSAVLGAIIGDVIGSPYEFDFNNIKTTDFPLFSRESKFTDDTVMTLAVAKGIMNGYGNPKKTESEIVKSMRSLGGMYPNAGYGLRFCDWLRSDEPMPYNSFGNGSAMRVSSVGEVYNNLDDVLKYAEISARVTHNHPEGIKGAQATAAAVFLSRIGGSKKEIKEYIERKFGYDLSNTCDKIRPNYHRIESCQGSVPQALTAFIEGTSFESVIRLAVSLGGDSDTIAAIAGGAAGAFYDIPDNIALEARTRLDNPLSEILNSYINFIKSEE